jgi:hypothetical protein
MVEHPALSPRSLVADILASTSLADLFLEMRLGCIGCSMTKFCTLEEVSHNYGIELDALILRFQERIDKP